MARDILICVSYYRDSMASLILIRQSYYEPMARVEWRKPKFNNIFITKPCVTKSYTYFGHDLKQWESLIWFSFFLNKPDNNFYSEKDLVEISSWLLIGVS